MSASHSVRPRARKTTAALIILLICLLATAALPLLSQAAGNPQPAPKKGKIDFIPGEVLVRFRSDQTATAKEQTIRTLDTKGRVIPIRIERFDGSDIVEGLRVARVAPAETFEALAALKRQPDVLYAEPNFIRRAYRTPNDANYSLMWGLKNTGQPNGNGNPGTPGADIDAEPAWDITTGSRSIVVGVIDEGVDVNHPDLQANLWRNPGEVQGNGVDDDGNGFIDDLNGWDFYHNDASVYDAGTDVFGDPVDLHGTHVAGTIGATGDNNAGVTGINWQVSLMSLKILGNLDAPAPSSVLVTVRAYNYAKMMRELWSTSGGTRGANLRVLNNSYGGAGRSQAELDAIRALSDAGILFIAAAGNDSRSNDVWPDYPSGYSAPNIISVAASTRGDLLANFTNRGAANVHMAAPGEGILSTTPNANYGYLSGTSMAAPHVAGAAALAYAVNPNLSVQRLRALLLYSGEVMQAQNAYAVLTSGRRLNAANALRNITDGDTVAPAAATDFHIGHQSFNLLTMRWNAPGDDGNTGQVAGYELRISDTPLSTEAQFNLARPVPATLPREPGSFESVDVTIPYQHPSGFIGLRAIDSSGNAGPITALNYSVEPNFADPYIVTQSAPEALSIGGTPLGLVADDEYKSYVLPFGVPLFNTNVVDVSTNGTLYFGFTPRLPDNTPGDPFSSVNQMSAYRMIAGAWDDLRTDRRAGDDIYIVKPDDNRVIFRWQGVTYNTPLSPTQSRGEHPVNFEIELRRDGTVITRYGAGNQNLFPVVGASLSNRGGDPYVIESHTSEYALKNLTNAQTVTFTVRGPTVAMPTFSLNDGAYNSAQQVVIKSPTFGATVHYTTNGQEPTQSDPIVFSGSTVTVDHSLTLKAKAWFSGMAPSAVRSAVYTISLPNPIDDARFFIRRHYLDFLNREPDSGGWDYWTEQLTGNSANAPAPCPPGDARCVHNRRLDASAAFFVENEFQRTGSFVYRFYKATYGARPTFQQFTSDRALVPEGPQLEQNKQAFANGWVQRPEFITKYPASQSGPAFVDAILLNVLQNSGVDLSAQRAGLIAAHDAGGRAQVVRNIADNSTFMQAEYNPAFVLMQYFGYLQRNPDEGGYQFWLNVVNNQVTNNYRAMVCAFVTSAEYQQRFGPTITRTNADCAP